MSSDVSRDPLIGTTARSAPDCSPQALPETSFDVEKAAASETGRAQAVESGLLAQVAATPLRDDMAWSDTLGYGAAPVQSSVDVMITLLKKHAILGWRRKRIIGIIVRMLLPMAVPFVAIFNCGEPQFCNEVASQMVATPFFPILLTMFVLLVFTQFVLEVVNDKECKMRYVQQVAGVSFSSYWFSYFIYFSVLSCFGTALLIGFLQWAAFYQYSNMFLMVCIFLLSFMQSFFLTMIVSAVFESAKIASVICAALGVVVVGGSSAIMYKVQSTQASVFATLGLIPFMSQINMLTAVGMLETYGIGFGWDICTSQNCDGKLNGIRKWDFPLDCQQHGPHSVPPFCQKSPTAADQFFILIGITVFYGLFALWFDQIWQGEFGAPRPFLFCFMPEYMCPRRQLSGVTDGAPAIKLTDLVKEFTGAHRAVDGMNLEVKNGEIFALLGHNGAGKTTAINCIVGMYSITSGSIEVCGIDVSTNLQEARKYLSVCPQDNPLYLEFTVDEHLSFFAALRAIRSAEMKAEIDSSLTALGMLEKRGARAATLSGGQKRRLWVATSLLGRSPLVFLDEPTSGMDPSNRRKLWDLLITMKELGRCIMFTTHYLDEADVLAERKAVLDQGKVKAIGTSFELKRHFGKGYHLRVSCLSDAVESKQQEILAAVRQHIEHAEVEVLPDAERAHRQGAPKIFNYVLPYADVGRFGALLQGLEAQAGKLGVIDFSLETTSLEEVFLALGQGGGAEDHFNGGVATQQQLTVVVPQAFDPTQPVQIAHPESGAPLLITLPVGAKSGEQHTVMIPCTQNHRALNLVSSEDRLAVSWVHCFVAVFKLRMRQVMQSRRSLLATFVVPSALIVFFVSIFSRLIPPEGALSPVLEDDEVQLFGGLMGMVLSVCMAIALPYFATQVVVDRVQRCTYVASSQGLPFTAYWGGTLLQNYVHLFLVALMAPASMLIFGMPFFTEGVRFAEILLVVLLFPLPMLLFAYNMSRLFSTSEACAKFMPGIALVASVAPYFGVWILNFVSTKFQLAVLETITNHFDGQFSRGIVETVGFDVPCRANSYGRCGNKPLFDQGVSLHFWAAFLHWLMCFCNPFYLLAGGILGMGTSGPVTAASMETLCPAKAWTHGDTDYCAWSTNSSSCQGESGGCDFSGCCDGTGAHCAELCKTNGKYIIDHLAVNFPSIGGSYVLPPIIGQLVLVVCLCLLLAANVERHGASLWKSVFGPRARAPDEVAAEPDQGGRVQTLSFVQDTDVDDEAGRASAIDPKDEAVVYRGLVHTYNPRSSRPVRAVRGVSLGISRGECFTLLGPNGAGKTTTLDVLTGAIYPPTQGDVNINGHSITASEQERRAALQNLGNCPQVDPLWPTLSGRQHLKFYGRIKGLAETRLVEQADTLLKTLGFSDFDADKPSQGYSGGMKRKLSLAIALIGSPPTLLLDEPSAAVDAAAKRHLWRVIKQRAADQTVILTTHSMEEAEALSDRLAIQVKGRLRCVGTPDHIKRTHGAGYQLEVVGEKTGSFSQGFRATPNPGVLAFVADTCPEAKLMEFHENRYLFQLPTLKAIGATEGQLSVARLFMRMNDAGSAGISDYSISQPSLEQVFLRFAKEQDELDENIRQDA